MNISSLVENKRLNPLQIRIISSAVLSFFYTYIFAFIIYGSLNYPLAHLIYDFYYAFVYFLLLYEAFRRFILWLNEQEHWLTNFYIRHSVGLLLFVMISQVLVLGVGILPFLIIFERSVGAIEWGVEIRLNMAVNALVASTYYLFLTGFQALKDYHYASINAEKLNREIAIAQFEGLKNQVNPHFLFNSLNVLSSLVHIDANLSEKFIDQLAKAYRYVLEQREHELVKLSTELDFIQSFVFLLKIRFEEKLKVNINIPAEKLNLFISPLSLQLLIENAVKHNILSADTPLVVDIHVDEENYLIVKNNVQLRKQAFSSTGVGLKNIFNRYKFLTSKKLSFSISGNEYIARIPLLEEQYEQAPSTGDKLTSAIS
jgi:sensor histidine kinase YesM